MSPKLKERQREAAEGSGPAALPAPGAAPLFFNPPILPLKTVKISKLHYLYERIRYQSLRFSDGRRPFPCDWPRRPWFKSGCCPVRSLA